MESHSTVSDETKSPAMKDFFANRDDESKMRDVVTAHGPNVNQPTLPSNHELSSMMMLKCKKPVGKS